VKRTDSAHATIAEDSALLDPDRLFPIEPRTRAVARDLHALIAESPIISPHGHVDPRLLLENEPFADPAELLITADHYVTRLLHAGGVDLGSLGLGEASNAAPREVWRALASRWKLFAGTASGYWLAHELATIFGVGELSAESADASFDRVSAALRDPGMLPRTLFERFRIEVIATTDDPLDDLHPQRALASDASFPGRVLPTFRPDAYISPADVRFRERVGLLMDGEGKPADDFAGYLQALEARRAYFIDHGAVSADHGVLEPRALDLEPAEAARLFRGAMSGALTGREQRTFAAHMLFQMARMSVRDGLVMTIHPGVVRNHSSETFRRWGPDTGHDIPIATSYTENLRPLLEAFGLERDFHLILFGIDESAMSREIAPLAGFYPSVYIGAPWWFLDAPDAILRFRAAVTETAGFYRGSGFIDDTRAFLSIPARHDAARRLDAAFLARLVCEGRISQGTAESIAVDLIDAIPRKAFKL
jgi:glucuronate isomerase